MTPDARPPRQLLEFLHQHDPAIQSLALGLRRVVHEELAPCHERIFVTYAVVLAYSSTTKVIKDGICSIVVYKKHVNLAFFRGSELGRPDVLAGTGKRWRHISLKKLSELDRPEIRACLRQARKLAGLPRSRRRTAGDVVTTVKASSGGW